MSGRRPQRTRPAVRALRGITEAVKVLDAVARGDTEELAGQDRWIAAFKTVSWVVEKDDTLVLTSAGHQARYNMELSATVH
jgi:hypothetical protein